jgi:aminobutyraldehyde dehydrogenase
MQHNLLINGELVAGEGEMVPVFNPANGEVILEIAEATEAQVNAAVEAADRAFVSWSQTTPKTRADSLLKLAEAITDHAEALAKLESLNCGKPLHCVMNDELPAVADVFRFFAGAARCLPGMAAGNIWRAHLDDSPGSGWRGGLYRAVELSVNDGGVEAGAGAGGRQLRGHQTVRDYAADGAEAG